MVWMRLCPLMCDSNQLFPIPLPGIGGDINSQLCPRPMGYHFRSDPALKSICAPPSNLSAPPRLARPDPFKTFALWSGLSLEKVARPPGTSPLFFDEKCDVPALPREGDGKRLIRITHYIRHLHLSKNIFITKLEIFSDPLKFSDLISDFLENFHIL